MCALKTSSAFVAATATKAPASTTAQYQKATFPSKRLFSGFQIRRFEA
jgi:hypothetical protein